MAFVQMMEGVSRFFREVPVLLPARRLSPEVGVLVERAHAASLRLFRAPQPPSQIRKEEGEELSIYQDEEVMVWACPQGEGPLFSKDPFLAQIKEISIETLAWDFYRDHVNRYFHCTFNGENVLTSFLKEISKEVLADRIAKDESSLTKEETDVAVTAFHKRLTEEFQVSPGIATRLILSLFASAELTAFVQERRYLVTHNISTLAFDPETLEPKDVLREGAFVFADEEQKEAFVADNCSSVHLVINWSAEEGIYFTVLYQLPLISFEDKMDGRMSPSHVGRLFYDSRSQERKLTLKSIKLSAYSIEEGHKSLKITHF